MFHRCVISLRIGPVPIYVGKTRGFVQLIFINFVFNNQVFFFSVFPTKLKDIRKRAEDIGLHIADVMYA